MGEQIFFDMDVAGAPPQTGSAFSWRKRQALQRSIVRWLEQRDPPTGIGLNVVTRVSRLRADVAAFWSAPARNRHEEGPSQILYPVRTAIVQCHLERDECWPDCIKSQTILPQLRALKEELAAVENHIREQEPELRATDTLFEEYSEWRYEDSRNRDYHRLKRAIEKLEHGLYHGTKFERIRSAHLADQLYLAVPTDIVKKEELADGWGLLWVGEDLSVSVAGECMERECLPSNRIHLVQNIAAAAKNGTLFSCGVRRTKDDAVVFVKPPRGHRRTQKVTLSDL